MLLKLNLLLLPTKIGREKRRLKEVGGLREALSPRRTRAPTTRKAPRKRSPKENISTAV